MTRSGRPARLLRGYGWWIILVTVLFTAGAYAASRVEPVEHRSTATVVAGSRQRANYVPVPADAGTEREIARSETVLRAAAERLSMAPGDLADGLAVETAEYGAAVTVAYTDSDAATAQQRAQAVAEEYVRYRNSTTTQSGIAATLVSPAGVAEEQRWSLWAYLTAGAAAGLLVGLATAVGLARRRDRLRGRGHYEQETGVPVLATVPRARRSRGAGAPLPVLLRAPDSADAESYRYLRARLDAGLQPPVTVLVAGGQDGEGRSTTAANLAVALAQAGRRVVLVDTDVRRPALHLMFDLSRDRGLTNVLTGQHTLAETLAAGAIVNLRVLAVGAERDNAADLLVAGGLSELLHELREQCDVVVLDSPPLLRVADAIGLAALADQVLLVTDYRRATRAGAVRIAAEFEQVAPGRVAAVLIDVPERDGGLIPRTRTGRAPAPAPLPQPPVDRFAMLDGPADPAPPPPNGQEPRPPHDQPQPPPQAAPQPEPRQPEEQPAAGIPKAKPISAKAAIPKPRVYTSAAAKPEAEASSLEADDGERVQAWAVTGPDADAREPLETDNGKPAEAKDAPAEK